METETIKFFYHGLQTDSCKFHPCFYGELSECFKNDDGLRPITVFSSDGAFPPEIENNFELIKSDEYKFRIMPDHPMYVQVKFACDLMLEKNKQILMRGNS